MRPQYVSQTGVGNSAIVPMDYRQQNFQISLQCNVTGTVSYTVQHTLANVFAGEVPVWIDHATLTAQSTTKDGNYAFPIMAFRVIVLSGTGTVDVIALQQSGS